LTGRGFTRLAKDQVSNFATEVLKGTEILAKRYYRELDGNELIDWAVDGFVHHREREGSSRGDTGAFASAQGCSR